MLSAKSRWRRTRPIQAMLAAADRAGVKHAYAATGCYAPAIQQTRLLLEQGGNRAHT